MRSYPRNSPQAAARIVALLLIADGHVSRSEMDALYGRDIEHELGLPPGEFGQVLHTLCEDLLTTAYGAAATMCTVDEATLASLMAELDEPGLQHAVLRLAGAAAGAGAAAEAAGAAEAAEAGGSAAAPFLCGVMRTPCSPMEISTRSVSPVPVGFSILITGWRSWPGTAGGFGGRGSVRSSDAEDRTVSV